MKPEEIQWQKIIAQLQKDKSALYDLYKDSQIQIEAEITLYFPNEEAKQSANSKRDKLKNKLPPSWQNKKIECKVGQLAVSPPPVQSITKTTNSRIQRSTSPLQALNHQLFDDNDTAKPALIAAVKAEENCSSLYQQLTEKTRQLAQETVTAEFMWRVRVGGIRGFNELLLPVFHPIYGVPYIPASSLKGVVRAWAKQHQPIAEVNRLLGKLEDGIGCVQFLDAFPTAPCLSVDIANPQWSWDNDRVRYQAVPHPLLSMEQPQISIGLTRTSRGTAADVSTVKNWLEQALSAGIGSRVSGGYGRTSATPSLSHHSSHAFKLWTQGIYGAERNIQEFRPVAVRGMLRYWFRAVGLSIYSPSQCKDLESRLFGTIEPQAQEGLIRIAVDWEETTGNRSNPYFCEGNIILEAKNRDALQLVEKLLQLSSHLAGIGRGSRRPLHWNDPPGLRGCHWEIETQKLSYDREIWQQFLRDVRDSFLVLQSPTENPGNCDPGSPGNRYQDVLNSQAQIYLVSCPGLTHPESVQDWQREGVRSEVRGEGLDLLYDNRFKGLNRERQGNQHVGGRIGNAQQTSTPSYVVIKSNFPSQGNQYQTVTIFGFTQGDRSEFIRKLRSLRPIQVH
jgi:CRISPR-associated protein Cmr6